MRILLDRRGIFVVWCAVFALSILLKFVRLFELNFGLDPCFSFLLMLMYIIKVSAVEKVLEV